MMFSYNVCLNKLQNSSVFSVDDSKALCKCVTKDAFYFFPGLVMSYVQGTDSFLKADVTREIDKVKTFDDFEKLSIESDTISNSDPFFKKQEIVYSTAMGAVFLVLYRGIFWIQKRLQMSCLKEINRLLNATENVVCID